MLGPGPVTENFHAETTKLTAQVSLLFKPLSDYFLQSSDGPINPDTVWNQYQQLHNIISYAAYLSLSIRLSPTIFSFTPMLPNAPYNPDDQERLEEEVFTASEENIVMQHREMVKSWTGERDRLEEEIEKLLQPVVEQQQGQGAPIPKMQAPPPGVPPAPAAIDEAAVQMARDQLAAHMENRPKHLYNYHALCKIAAWPNIRRFKPGSKKEEEQPGLSLEEKHGFRILEVMKSAGVFYYGVEDGMERNRTAVDLGQFVKWRQSGGRGGGQYYEES